MKERTRTRRKRHKVMKMYNTYIYNKVKKILTRNTQTGGKKKLCLFFRKY